MSQFSASRLYAPVATTTLALLLAAASPAQTPNLGSSQNPVQATASVSKVRIVRLSEVRGAVQLDRSVGHGFEPAIPNLPVVEGNKLKTEVGVAEVEFEDNSTLRLAPNSEVEFTELGRAGNGSTISSVRLLKGMAYVSLLKPPSKSAIPNQFELSFGDRKIALPPDTHVRLQMDGEGANAKAELAVLDGSLRVDGPGGVLDVPHKKTVTFALADESEPLVGKSEADGPLDAWDKQSVKYHEHVASFANYGGAPYSYGLSDMMYYGAFADAGGCGMMWRPYFASAAWNPYGSGAWAYYSGAGYSWVSPYPWGWTPYHYGSWSFCPGTGWGWMPGGAWYGLNNNNVVTLNTLSGRSKSPVKPRGGPVMPVAPKQPPRAGQSTLLGHNLTALVHSGAVGSGVDGEGAFVFRKDSAGMGIPRNELGGLRGFSQRADRRGTAATPIYVNAGGRESFNGRTSAASGGFHAASSTFAPVAIHRGFAPSAPSMSNSSSSFSRGSVGSTSSGVSATSTMSMPSAHVSAPSGGGAHH